MLKQRLLRLALFVGPLALAVAAVGNVSQSASYELHREVLTGVVPTSSASFVVKAAQGQLSTDTATSASFRVQGGFWPLVQGALVFADGFENGDVGGWTGSSP